MTRPSNLFLSFFFGAFVIASSTVLTYSSTWGQTVISPGAHLELLFIERYVSGRIRYGPGTLYRSFDNRKAWGTSRGGRGLPLRTYAATGIDVSSYSQSGFDDAGISAWTNTEFHVEPFFLMDPPSHLESFPAKIYLNGNVVIETSSTGSNAIAEAEAVVAFGYIGDREHPLFYREYSQSTEIREVIYAHIKTKGTMGYIKSANSWSSGVVSGFGLATAECSVVFDPVIEWDQEEFDKLMGDNTFPLNEYVGLYISDGVRPDGCWLDIEPEDGDGDVDGLDLALYSNGLNIDVQEFDADFGRNDCPRLINSYWATYYKALNGIELGPFYVNLIQDGDRLIGSWICDDLGMIAGTLQETNIILSWNEDGEIVTLVGQVDGNTMAGVSGPYSWRAEKVSEPQCDL